MLTAERHWLTPDYGIACHVTEHELCTPKQVFEKTAQNRGRIQSDCHNTADMVDPSVCLADAWRKQPLSYILIPR
jgi:hypothetical protein